jgi:capsular polysaccharide transport system permease protein
MDNAGPQLKRAAAASRQLTLVERAGQFLPNKIRVSLPFHSPSPSIEEEPSSTGWSKALISYVILVLFPVLAHFAYTVAIETPGYVSETRVTVRSAPKKHISLSANSSSMLSRLISTVASDTDRDSYIVLNYVKSAAIIDDLGGRPALERFFSKPEIDYVSRLAHGEPMEDLLQYWRSRVSANVDTVSGLLTIKITAYSPKDALDLVQSVNSLSEKLINNISLRVREDALDKAKLEVTRASDELAARREALLSFQNSNELLDPTTRAKSLGETIAKLTLEKVDIDTALSLLVRSNATDAPSDSVLKSKLATLDQQIDNLKSQLTAPAGNNAVSSQLAAYEALKLKQEFAEKIYVIAEDAYLRAEQELQRQQLYLVVVVKPTHADEATYPKIIPSTMLLTVCLTIVWSISALILASIRDQID